VAAGSPMSAKTEATLNQNIYMYMYYVPNEPNDSYVLPQNRGGNLGFFERLATSRAHIFRQI